MATDEYLRAILTCRVVPRQQRKAAPRQVIVVARPQSDTASLSVRCALCGQQTGFDVLSRRATLMSFLFGRNAALAAIGALLFLCALLADAPSALGIAALYIALYTPLWPLLDRNQAIRRERRSKHVALVQRRILLPSTQAVPYPAVAIGTLPAIICLIVFLAGGFQGNFRDSSYIAGGVFLTAALTLIPWLYALTRAIRFHRWLWLVSLVPFNPITPALFALVSTRWGGAAARARVKPPVVTHMPASYDAWHSAPAVLAAPAAAPTLPAAAAPVPPAPVSPAAERFRMQVEAALSAEARAQLRMSFGTAPVCAIFTLGETQRGWFACQELDPVTKLCGIWLVSFPDGSKQAVPANGQALLDAIRHWQSTAQGGSAASQPAL